MRPNLRTVPELGDVEPQTAPSPASAGNRRRRVRLVGTAIIIALLSGVLFFAHPAPAKAEPNADEAQFLALLNGLRAKLLLPPLASDPQLTNVARAWSSKMASDGAISHNPALATQITDWRTCGENVGTGGSVTTIEAALEASPHHYENMTDKAYNYVGIGVVELNGNIWVTQDFKQSKSGLPGVAVPKQAPPPPKAAPKPPPAPRPPSGGATAAPKAPTAPRSARNPAASPAAAAAAAGSSGPTDTAASATSAPGPSPVTGPESAKPAAASALPPGLATVSPASSTMDGPRLASLALFAVLGAIALLATRGSLKLPDILRR